MTKTLLLDCGSGGRASQRLINELFLEQFDNPILWTLDDAARLELSGPIAMSTDGYTVTPLFFPGGNHRHAGGARHGQRRVHARRAAQIPDLRLHP